LATKALIKVTKCFASSGRIYFLRDVIFVESVFLFARFPTNNSNVVPSVSLPLALILVISSNTAQHADIFINHNANKDICYDSCINEDNLDISATETAAINIDYAKESVKSFTQVPAQVKLTTLSNTHPMQTRAKSGTV